MATIRQVPSDEIEMYHNNGIAVKRDLDKKFFLELPEGIQITDIPTSILRVSRIYAEAVRNKTTIEAVLSQCESDKNKLLFDVGTSTRYKNKVNEELMKSDKGNMILATLSMLETSKSYYSEIIDYLRIMFKALETISMAEGIMAKLTR